MRVHVKLFLFILISHLGLAFPSEPEHIRYANAISSRVAAQIEKEFNLHCDSEGGSMPHNVTSIRLGFSANRRATLEEARALHVRCTEMLTKAVNEDERIRPFLAEHPFPASRIQISLAFRGPYGPSNYDGTINHVFAAQGKIFYRIQDPIDVTIRKFYEESYADALQLVQQSPFTNTDLCSHQVKPYEPAFDHFIQTVVPKICKQWQLHCLKAGGNIRDGVEELGFTFLKRSPTPLAQARTLEIAVTDFLMQQINHNESLKPYLKNYPLHEDRIRVRIVFGKNNEYDNFRDGVSLYEVRPVNGRLLYHFFPPTPPGDSISLTPDVVANESYTQSRLHAQETKVQ